VWNINQLRSQAPAIALYQCLLTDYETVGVYRWSDQLHWAEKQVSSPPGCRDTSASYGTRRLLPCSRMWVTEPYFETHVFKIRLNISLPSKRKSINKTLIQNTIQNVLESTPPGGGCPEGLKRTRRHHHLQTGRPSIAQAPTAAARVRAGSGHVAFVDKVTREDRFSPNTWTDPHSSSTIRSWYNRPNSGPKWTQSHPTPRTESGGFKYRPSTFMLPTSRWLLKWHK
jgi:hypothetical protein